MCNKDREAATVLIIMTGKLKFLSEKDLKKSSLARVIFLYIKFLHFQITFSTT